MSDSTKAHTLPRILLRLRGATGLLLFSTTSHPLTYFGGDPICWNPPWSDGPTSALALRLVSRGSPGPPSRHPGVSYGEHNKQTPSVCLRGGGERRHVPRRLVHRRTFIPPHPVLSPSRPFPGPLHPPPPQLWLHFSGDVGEALIEAFYGPELPDLGALLAFQGSFC